MMPSHSFVIARYNENVEWTRQFNNVYIYNKGEKLDNTIVLPNIGREGHTYFKHIVDNYHNLTDFIIFLQGNPYDHSPNIINNLNNILLDTCFQFLSEYLFEYKLSVGCKYHPHLPLIDSYKKIFLKNPDNDMLVQFGAGAQFVVSKNQILKRPIYFYQNILNFLETEEIAPWVIERFIFIIFN